MTRLVFFGLLLLGTSVLVASFSFNHHRRSHSRSHEARSHLVPHLTVDPWPDQCSGNQSCNTTSSLSTYLTPTQLVTTSGSWSVDGNWVMTLTQDIVYPVSSDTTTEMVLLAWIRIRNADKSSCDMVASQCWVHLYFTTDIPLEDIVLGATMHWDGDVVVLCPSAKFVYAPHPANQGWQLSFDTCESDVDVSTYCRAESRPGFTHHQVVRVSVPNKNQVVSE
jgi:hypothetical protein